MAVAGHAAAEVPGGVLGEEHARELRVDQAVVGAGDQPVAHFVAGVPAHDFEQPVFAGHLVDAFQDVAEEVGHAQLDGFDQQLFLGGVIVVKGGGLEAHPAGQGAHVEVFVAAFGEQGDGGHQDAALHGAAVGPFADFPQILLDVLAEVARCRLVGRQARAVAGAPYFRFAHRSCTSRHMILPLPFLGRASTKSTIFGTLYEAMFSRHHSTRVSASRPGWSARRTTTARTVSPR